LFIFVQIFNTVLMTNH